MANVRATRYSVKDFAKAWLAAAFPRWEGAEAIVSWGITWLASVVVTLGLPSSIVAGLGFNPAFFIASLACICLLLIAPYTLWRDVNLRLAAVEATLTPCLSVECKTESGLKLGDDRACLAYLVVTNIGGGQIRNAYVQVAEIVEHVSASGGMRPYRQRLYRHQDVFLKWQATEERLHSFHVSANAHVARGRSGDGRYGLVSVGGVLFPGLQLYDKYEISLVVAADDLPVSRPKLFLRMETCVTKNEKGESTLWIGVPFEVEFRDWQAADELEEELDLDAIRLSTPDTEADSPT